eukprot:TRINITY_DN12855_c0_g1_i4.p1 TRINITY_DN12855_c0_g1~~TRINITY_DN12855_c0_g1_i4.p1  ORF type:complete len:312 (+),score=77.22 TRINITY_DN12855_c0_g1_i4:65-937(+)
MGYEFEVQDELLAQQLDSPDHAAREKAVKHLGRLAPSTVAAAEAKVLTQCLKDVHPAVRKQAARALGKMGEVALPHAAALAEALEDSDAGVRAAAAGAIGWLTDRLLDEEQWSTVLGALAKCLEDRHPRARVAAVGAFGHLGRRAVCGRAQALAACLHDADLHVRVAAAGALAGHLEALVSALVGQLLAAKEKAATAAAAAAARALGQLGEAAAPHLKEALQKDLASRDAGARSSAAGDSALCLPRLLGTPKARSTPKTKKVEEPSFCLPPNKGGRVESLETERLRAAHA